MGNQCDKCQNAVSQRSNLIKSAQQKKSYSTQDSFRGYSSILKKLNQMVAPNSSIIPRFKKLDSCFDHLKKLSNQEILSPEDFSADFHLLTNSSDILLQFLNPQRCQILLNNTNCYQYFMLICSLKAYYIYLLQQATSYISDQKQKDLFINFKCKQRSHVYKTLKMEIQKLKQKFDMNSFFILIQSQEQIHFVQKTLKIRSNTFSLKENRLKMYQEIKLIDFSENNKNLRRNYFSKVLSQVYYECHMKLKSCRNFQRRNYLQLMVLFLYLNIFSRGDWSSIILRIKNFNEERFKKSYIMQYASKFDGVKYIVKTIREQTDKINERQIQFLKDYLKYINDD